MKRVFGFLIVIVLAIGIFYVINRKPDCASIELKKLDLQGDSQLLIGYSDVTNDLLSLSLSFNGDSTQFEIFSKTKGLISQGFSLGDYLSDSVMLVFDEDQKPFLYNQSTGA